MKIGNGWIKCSVDNGAWIVTTSISGNGGVYFPSITNDDCNLPMNAYTLTVNFSITEGFKDKSIYCHAFHADAFSPSELTIPKVLCK